MTVPTWQDLRDAGHVLLDRSEHGLAIYPTAYGNVVIAVRGEGGALHHVPIQLSEFDAVATALAESEARAAVAQKVLHEQESAFAAHHLIQRAKGAA